MLDDELLISVGLEVDSNNSVYTSDGVFQFFIKAFPLDIGANGDMRMTCPRIEGLFIQGPSKLNTLASGIVVGPCVELLSADSSSDQVKDAIVSLVSKGRPSPPLQVHYCLEFLAGNVCSRVAGTPVANDNRGGFAHLGQTSEIVLHVYLEPNQQALETYAFLD